MSTASTVRINITIPNRLITELEKEIPERGKSGFISEAIEEKLIREKRKRALKRLANLPPTFRNIPSGKEYIETERITEDKERSLRLEV
jgi:hypothetical protein